MALEQYFLEEGKNVSDLSTMALIYRLFSDYRWDYTDILQPITLLAIIACL